MNTNDQDIESVIHARKMVRWMGQGVVPSQENANLAQGALRDYIASGDGDVNPRVAVRVTGAIAMGILPSEQMCNDAAEEITQVIDSMREKDSNKLRDEFRQRC